jgi:arabinose-5-phosphate isomerase
LQTLQLAIEVISKIDTDQFAPAVEAMHDCRGRIICTGVGKSGHIARKTAATIASIAMPCHFVHATEASHGDLGCVSSDDICIAFSHSGNTPELAGILEHCAWLNVPVIAITSNETSTLGKAAKYAIIYPNLSEAWANAPTTSTTAQIVIGDALAVMLAERLGKKAEDFHQNHPGGAIGAKHRN